MRDRPGEESLAALLTDARAHASQIRALPDKLVPLSNADGYAAAADVADRLGWEPLGWKIAGTTQAVRDKLRIDEPIYGRTYRRFAQTSPCSLRHSELLDPLVECEFFVTLVQDLPPRDAPWSIDDVRAAIGTVHAGVEVAECRFPNIALPPLPAILADGAASGRYVFGHEIPNWRDGLSALTVILDVDGQPRREGTGQDVMGDPITPLHWLAETLRSRGMGLLSGETVSTGSCTGMFPVQSGAQIAAHFGDRARVEIDFTA